MSTEMISFRVVIIEDEGMVAMLLEDMLTDLGYEVVAIVGRLDRAAQLISDTSADVVVLDVNLDGEQTYPLASALAARGTPFVFSTGYGSAGIEQEWRGRPLLQKPFQAQDLERAMRQALGGAALDRTP